MNNNKIIAEFMGYPDLGTEGDFTYLKYHREWNWLMPVVEKINSLKCKDNGYYGVEIFPNAVRIEDGDSNEIVLLNQTNESFETLKQAIYQAVVEFIKEYNDEDTEKEGCDECGYCEDVVASHYEECSKLNNQ
tara:strand:- start:3207 stop:3605 length:399 start_codon:yes stop_codon:yes gene_type:complete